MKISINKPDTIQFSLRMEKGDEFYQRCMWARVTFDNKNWSLMAQSDCGDYSYSWYPEEKRTFLDLMQSLDEDYLLGKISSRSEFDLESSKDIVISWLDDPDSETLKAIQNIYASDANDFLLELDEVDGLESYSDLWECIQYDFPASAKVFAKLFVTYIQPEIRKYLENEKSEGFKVEI